MNTIIRTLPQLQQTQSTTWIFGLIVTGIALAVAIGIAFLINWRSDRKDFLIRRIWFILIGLIFPAGYWLYTLRVTLPKIPNPGFKNMLESTNLYVLLVSIGLYTLVGLLLMYSFRNTKLGSILGKKKN